MRFELTQPEGNRVTACRDSPTSPLILDGWEVGRGASYCRHPAPCYAVGSELPGVRASMPRVTDLLASLGGPHSKGPQSPPKMTCGPAWYSKPFLVLVASKSVAPVVCPIFQGRDRSGALVSRPAGRPITEGPANRGGPFRDVWGAGAARVTSSGPGWVAALTWCQSTCASLPCARPGLEPGCMPFALRPVGRPNLYGAPVPARHGQMLGCQD